MGSSSYAPDAQSGRQSSLLKHFPAFPSPAEDDLELSILPLPLSAEISAFTSVCGADNQTQLHAYSDSTVN